MHDNKLNKKELADEIARHNNITKKDAFECLEIVLHGISETLCEGKGFSIHNFMTFEIQDRKGGKGRNPKEPDKVIEYPDYKMIVCKVSPTIKDKVRKL